MSSIQWDTYRNRKSALQYLRQNGVNCDLILETEDGSCSERTHLQVMSALGDKFNDYLNKHAVWQAPTSSMLLYPSPSAAPSSDTSDQMAGRLRLVRLQRVDRYTLTVLAECAYTGCIRTDLTSGGIWQVLEVASHYEMGDVVRACCSFLVKNLARHNCVHFYHVGSRHGHQLQKFAWRTIRANFKHILEENLRRSDAMSLFMSSQHLGVGNSLNNLAHSLTQSLLAEATGPDGPPSASLSSTAALGAPQEGQAGTSRPQSADLARLEHEQRANNLATIQYDHFAAMLAHDRLNVDCEETVWLAIRHWCNFEPAARAPLIGNLLSCVRFARLRSGTQYSARAMWPDPLVQASSGAQQQLAVLDRNHRDYLASLSRLPASSPLSLVSLGILGPSAQASRPPNCDGHLLPCAVQPRQARPRVPRSVLLAIGGWKQGQPTTLIESYDVNCNLWFECEPSVSIMNPLAYHGAEFVDGLLYICGGTNGTDILNEMFTFDPVRAVCIQRNSMHESRCYVSTAVLDNKLYAIGGHNGDRRMRSVERYDLHEQQWSLVADMNVARSDASACVHNSFIYIAGGLNEQIIENSVEFYNPQDNSWTFVASMMSPRTSFTLLVYDNSLLAIGGNNGAQRLDTVEQYNFVTQLWAPHSTMRHSRSTFSAAILDEQKLIVVGGYNGQTPFSQVEMYSRELGAWVELCKMRCDRSGLKVVAMNDLSNVVDYTFLGHATRAAAATVLRPPTRAAAPTVPRPRSTGMIGHVLHYHNNQQHQQQPLQHQPQSQQQQQQQHHQQQQQQQQYERQTASLGSRARQRLLRSLGSLGASPNAVQVPPAFPQARLARPSPAIDQGRPPEPPNQNPNPNPNPNQSQ